MPLFLFLCCGGLHHGAVGKFPAVQVQVLYCVHNRARETRYIHIASHGQAPHGITDYGTEFSQQLCGAMLNGRCAGAGAADQGI